MGKTLHVSAFILNNICSIFVQLQYFCTVQIEEAARRDERAKSGFGWALIVWSCWRLLSYICAPLLGFILLFNWRRIWKRFYWLLFKPSTNPQSPTSEISNDHDASSIDILIHILSKIGLLSNSCLEFIIIKWLHFPHRYLINFRSSKRL